MGKDSTLVVWNKEHCVAQFYAASITTLLFFTQKKFLPGEYGRSDTVFFLQNGLEVPYSHMSLQAIEWSHLS